MHLKVFKRAVLVTLLCLAGTTPLSLRADEQSKDKPSETSQPRQGTEEFTSMVSEVDACNQAQYLRPAGSTVTKMHYWRIGQAGERGVTCMINWSTAADAEPTDRPILFGRHSN